MNDAAPRDITGEQQSSPHVARTRFGLTLLSGVMLGVSFPPSPSGVFACFGLVPLLVVLADMHTVRSALRHIYVAMLLFHVITLNWTGGYVHMHDPYMMIAGAITMIVHPLFYWLPGSAYMLVRKYLGDRPALIALPFLWVGYEYSHSLSEWSFPWLTLGNSQTYSLATIQCVSITGVFGLSFWILCVNVLAYLLYSRVARHEGRILSWAMVPPLCVLLAVYALPRVYGAAVLSGTSEVATDERADSIRVGIIQSNVDPWEKWQSDGRKAVDLYLDLTRDLCREDLSRKPDLVLWPETAIPDYLLLPSRHALFERLTEGIDSLDVAVLTGTQQAVIYTDSSLAPPSAKRSPVTGERYDAFNAAVLLEPGSSATPWYGKMKMVPIAERVPYADMFYQFDFLRWGVGIGGWQIGRDTVVFRERATGARFSTMICYESTYPGFVAAFVRKGAEFITIITIDSWWGRMSGAYQHQQYAILRAVENRRWIARCAVGGFSCFIDPYGHVLDKTDLFTRTVRARTIGRATAMTFYTEHGDWPGELCLLIAGFFLAATAGSAFTKRTRLWQQT